MIGKITVVMVSAPNLTLEEERKVRSVANVYLQGFVCKLTGLRAGREALHPRWIDVDFKKGLTSMAIPLENHPTQKRSII